MVVEQPGEPGRRGCTYHRAALTGLLCPADRPLLSVLISLLLGPVPCCSAPGAELICLLSVLTGLLPSLSRTRKRSPDLLFSHLDLQSSSFIVFAFYFLIRPGSSKKKRASAARHEGASQRVTRGQVSAPRGGKSARHEGVGGERKRSSLFIFSKSDFKYLFTFANTHHGFSGYGVSRSPKR